MESSFLESSYSTISEQYSRADRQYSDNNSSDRSRNSDSKYIKEHDGKYEDGYKIMKTVITTPCCSSKEKVYIKVRESPQVYLLGYLLNPYVLTTTTSIIPFNRASSTFPKHYCNGVFTIPNCTDGLYQIIVVLDSTLATGMFNLVITDDTGLYSNVVTNVSIVNNRQVMTIIVRLKSGFTIRVTGSGTGTILGDNNSYLNIVRVA